MSPASQERRSIVRRKADRELFDLIEKKTGIKPEQLVRERKLRRAIRHTCKAVIDLEVRHSAGDSGHWESDSHQLKARVLDMSEGGASLFCKHELKQGARCRVSIKLYDGSSVDSPAEVRWTSHKPQKDGYALGLQFTGIDARNQKRLKAFLEDLDSTLGLGSEAAAG